MNRKATEREREREYFPQKKFKGDMPWVTMQCVHHCKRTGRLDSGSGWHKMSVLGNLVSFGPMYTRARSE